MRRRIPVWVTAFLFVGGAAVAQTSSSYNLEEHSLNSGGNPANGATPSSTSYQLSIDAIGTINARGLSSASFMLDAGFVGAYPPPVEVINLIFTGNNDFEWDPFPGIGTYNVYRGVIGNFDPGYGACSQTGLTTNSASDGDPISSPGFFYLVTTENRLAEEGTKGSNDLGERTGTFCMP